MTLKPKITRLLKRLNVGVIEIDQGKNNKEFIDTIIKISKYKKWLDDYFQYNYFMI